MIDLDALITGGIGLLTTVASSIISWTLARKKFNTEVDHNYIENIEAGLKTYDAIIAHNKLEIEYLMKENCELRAEIAELRKQVLNLTMNICMDLTCTSRVREKVKQEYNMTRFNETKKPEER